MQVLPILLICLGMRGLLGATDVAVAAAVAAANPAMVPALVQSVEGGFVSISEWVIFDAITEIPASLRNCPRFSAESYIRASAQDHPHADLHVDPWDGEFILVSPGRWLLAKTYSSLVRRSSIDVIDDRMGSGQWSPPTPAPSLGGKPSGMLAQPHACGLTLCAGSARVFCGVRSAARSLAITSSDVQALASAAQLPSAARLLELISCR